MKTVVLILLIISAVAAHFGPKARQGAVSKDYEDIIKYVLSVEKGGFSQSEFDAFSYERKVNRKGIHIGTPASLFCDFISSGAALLAFGLTLVFWRRAPGTRIDRTE